MVVSLVGRLDEDPGAGGAVGRGAADPSTVGCWGEVLAGFGWGG